MKIKQDSYSNKQYNLTVEDTEKLIKHYFIKAYPDVKFDVHKSDCSDSIYVDIEYMNSRSTLRISDHEISKYNHTYIVSECTPIYHVAKYINVGISNLMKYRVYRFLDMNRDKLL